MTTTAVALSLPVYDIENEPRVLDTDLAKALGMERPTNIRTRIKGMWTDLEQLGPMHSAGAKVAIGSGAQREVTAFYLNEEQATLITMAVQTPRAREVKVLVARVFTAWRRGQLQPVAAPALPDFTDPAAAARAWAERFEGERLALAAKEHERTLRVAAQAETEALKPAAAVGATL